MNSHLGFEGFSGPGIAEFERKRMFSKRAARNIMRKKMARKSKQRNRK